MFPESITLSGHLYRGIIAIGVAVVVVIHGCCGLVGVGHCFVVVGPPQLAAEAGVGDKGHLQRRRRVGDGVAKFQVTLIDIECMVIKKRDI